MSKKDPAEKVVRDIRRKTRRKHSTEEKIRIVLEGLRGEDSIELRRDTIRKAARRPVVKALVSDEDAPLLSALKAKRRALAEAAKVPAYIIFNDRTLIEMAETRPADLDAMARVAGVGAKKLERYGADFLEVINGAADHVHPTRRKLAGRPAGDLFDQLQAAQAELARGEDGTGKYLSCNTSTLRHIAERKPDDLDTLSRLPGMGEQKTERFGSAFLDVLREAG